MIHFITLSVFPEIFKSPLNYSILKRAIDSGLIKVSHYDIRDFTTNKHKKIDDEIYGGGAGQLIMPQPVFDAIEYIKKDENNIKTIFFTPKGKVFNSKLAKKFSLSSDKDTKYILLCGRYEGIDNRIRENLVDYEISIGDFVLSGGELAALVFIDAVSRHIPRVLGNEESLKEESFSNNLLEYPQYTRPADFRGMKVPEILLSGHHGNIEKWRREEQIKLTKKIRKDMLDE